MPALAYLLLPLSGMTAYFLGTDPRMRFHGLQAVVLGLIWPVALFACSTVSALATQGAFALGVFVWLGLIVTSATGRDLRLPVVGSYCARAVGLSTERDGRYSP